MKHFGYILCISLAILAIGTGCKAKKQVSDQTPQTTQEQANAQNADSNQADKQGSDAQVKDPEPQKANGLVTPAKRLKLADLKPIVQKVHVDDEMGNPKATEPNAEFPAVYNLTNGEEADHSIYVEGKGYFSGNAESFYETLTKSEWTGPIFLTKSITIEDLKSSPEGTTFIMHIGKGNGFEETFDIGVTIDTIYDENDKIIGRKYHSQKIGGSNSIQKADTEISIYQFGPVQTLIEYRSVYQAPMINSENARKGMDVLFDHWNSLSENYVKAFESKNDTAQDSAQKKCKKWGSNPMFVDGHEFTYSVESSHEVSFIDDNDVLCDDNVRENCWDCKNTKEREDCTKTQVYELKCKSSLIQAEASYCAAKISCAGDKVIDEVYLFNNSSDNALPTGIWAVDANGIYFLENANDLRLTKQPKPGNCKKTKYIKCKPETLAYEYTEFSKTEPLIPFTKPEGLSESDEDENFSSSLTITHKGTVWEREDSASGPDDFWGGVTIDETKGITQMKGGHAGAAEYNISASLEEP